MKKIVMRLRFKLIRLLWEPIWTLQTTCSIATIIESKEFSYMHDNDLIEATLFVPLVVNVIVAQQILDLYIKVGYE